MTAELVQLLPPVSDRVLQQITLTLLHAWANFFFSARDQIIWSAIAVPSYLEESHMASIWTDSYDESCLFGSRRSSQGADYLQVVPRLSPYEKKVIILYSLRRWILSFSICPRISLYSSVKALRFFIIKARFARCQDHRALHGGSILWHQLQKQVKVIASCLWNLVTCVRQSQQLKDSFRDTCHNFANSLFLKFCVLRFLLADPLFMPALQDIHHSK